MPYVATFIGGPIGGRRCAINEALPYYYVPIIGKFTTVCPTEEALGNANFRKATYALIAAAGHHLHYLFSSEQPYING